MARRKHRIPVKSKSDILKMKRACALTAETLLFIADKLRPGISTAEIDNLITDFIFKKNAAPAFLNYRGFPASACISINEEVIHGIPADDKLLNHGDIVSIDFGVKLDGFYGDAARSFIIGAPPDDKKSLVDTAENAFFSACELLKPGVALGDISNRIQSVCEAEGYGVVRDYVGHGIGVKLHEPPQIPNFGTAGSGPIIPAGATLAIEPMVTLGHHKVHTLDDGWTVVTADGLPSSHYENTVLITDNGYEILTKI